MSNREYMHIYVLENKHTNHTHRHIHISGDTPARHLTVYLQPDGRADSAGAIFSHTKVDSRLSGRHTLYQEMGSDVTGGLMHADDSHPRLVVKNLRM